MNQLLGILAGLLILGIMLALHEFGHYIAGRLLGFKIIEFSIFMGPRLFSWEKNGIKYSLKLIPIGASVEFAGENSSEEEDESEEPYVPGPGDFYERPRWARAITLLAGPFMNLLTAFLVFAVMNMSLGFSTTKIGAVAADSLAARAGVEANERVVAIGSYKVNTNLDLSIGLQLQDQTKPYDLRVETANGQEKTYTIEPATRVQYVLGISVLDDNGVPVIQSLDTERNPDATKFVLGDRVLEVDGNKVTSVDLPEALQAADGSAPIKVKVFRGSSEVELEVKLAPVDTAIPLGISLEGNETAIEAIPYTLSYMWSYTKGTGAILGQVFTGRIAAQDSLTGPVGIVNIFSDVVSSGYDFRVIVIQLASLFAMVSLALGIGNLLPIVPLDGGQLLLLLIETIRRKRLSEKTQNIVTMAGVIFVLALAVLALTFDLGRIFGG